MRWSSIVTCLTGILLSTNASAQTGLVAPERVMIYVHRDVQDTDFVEPLVCELSRVLIAPVSEHISDLPIDISMMASMTELDARRVVPAFYQSTTQTTSTCDYAFLIIPYDLQNENTHHTFGTNFGMPYNPALDAKPADFCADDRAKLVEARVLKEKPDASCRRLVSSLRRRPRAMAIR